jgi:hypothetical protein
MSDYRIEGLPFEAQYLDNWCWAAVARAIAKVSTGQSRRQCEIVTQRRNEDNCAPGSARDGIDDLTEVLYRVLGIDVDFHNRELLDRPDDAFPLIESAIRSDRPVALNIRWADGAYHYVCAYGVRSDEGGRGFWIYDPSRSWQGSGNSRFAALADMEEYAEAPPPHTGRQGRWMEAFWPT